MTQEAGPPLPAVDSPSVDCSPTEGFEIPRIVKPHISIATKLAVKVLQANEVQKEMKRLGKRGIRFLPKGRLDKFTISMINAWADKMNNSAKASDNLLIAGMDQAEKGVASIREFNRLKESIKESAKLGQGDLPGLWQKSIWFNPQVAGELLKLAFSLNRSISFVCHLVLLYGLEALAEELSTVGPHPPTEILSPSKSLAQNQKQAVRNDVQKERDEAFYERNPGWDQKNRPGAHIVKADMEPKSKAEGYKYHD
jgi:hypothetical protein